MRTNSTGVSGVANVPAKKTDDAWALPVNKHEKTPHARKVRFIKIKTSD